MPEANLGSGSATSSVVVSLSSCRERTYNHDFRNTPNGPAESEATPRTTRAAGPTRPPASSPPACPHSSAPRTPRRKPSRAVRSRARTHSSGIPRTACRTKTQSSTSRCSTASRCAPAVVSARYSLCGGGVRGAGGGGGKTVRGLREGRTAGEKTARTSWLQSRASPPAHPPARPPARPPSRPYVREARPRVSLQPPHVRLTARVWPLPTR